MIESLDAVAYVLGRVTLAVLLLVTLYKLWVLHRNTRQWNGLGRAIRDEKWVYAALWLWMLVRPLWHGFGHPAWLLGLALALIVVTLRVALLLPHVGVYHKDGS